MAAATLNHAATVDPIVASHKLPDGELDTWDRNMSTDRTLYTPSTYDTPTTYDGASTHTDKASDPATKSLKDRFKLVFRRKKKHDAAEVTPPDRKQSADFHKRLSTSSDKSGKSKKDKLVWKDEPRRFSVDSQTGEIKDHTAMMHALVHRESFDSIPEYVIPEKENRPPGEDDVASPPPKVWQHVTDYLTLSDTANLAFSSKVLLDKLGNASWDELKRPYAKQDRLNFLMRMDRAVPGHLYCPLCEIYHVRIQKGQESLKPTTTLNYLFNCPHVDSAPPRTRIASGRTLPFTFVQLALRAHKYGPDHGITVQSLARRWREPETGWSHSTIYRVHNGHLLMRVISQKFAKGGMVDAAKRVFFYNMFEDFTPYFSVCAHWRDGELMPVCKCAVGHIPEPRYSITEAHKIVKTELPQAPRIVALCGVCQPMRRCPECPTEYLVEVKLVEDQKDPIHKFKQAFVVTRWSDLGDGSSPDNIEWAAINGQAYYSSVIEIGRRAISGIFESKVSSDNMNIPGQRVISLNPKGEKQGEDGDTWY